MIEYKKKKKKKKNLIDDTTNQPSKLNDESRGTCNVNSDIKFKTSMISSNLCDYSDAYIHVKVTQHQLLEL